MSEHSPKRPRIDHDFTTEEEDVSVSASDVVLPSLVVFDDVDTYIHFLQNELLSSSYHENLSIGGGGGGAVRELTFAEAGLEFRENKFINNFSLHEITYPAPLSSGLHKSYIISGVTAPLPRWEHSKPSPC